MKTGTRVKLSDNPTTQAWGHAGEIGTVVGQDPRGINSDVRCVKLDSGPSVFEEKGIHVGHLHVLTDPARVVAKR